VLQALSRAGVDTIACRALVQVFSVTCAKFFEKMELISFFFAD